MEERTEKLKRKNDKEIARKKNRDQKLKVSVFSPIMLRIGKWKFEPTNEAELVVNSYFARKQLVWEVLINGCKEMIEIEWSNIAGIRTALKENEPGILEVELSEPPKFYKKLNNVNREHGTWVDGSDFTEGQAFKCRRHLLMFPPGVLKEHFEKLICYDERLCELSQRGYPTFGSPYFLSETLLNNVYAFQQRNGFRMPSFRVPTQQFQPSNNQTLQLGTGNLIQSRPAVALPLHLNETIQQQPMIGSSNNVQMQSGYHTTERVIPRASSSSSSSPILLAPTIDSEAANFNPQQSLSVGHFGCSNGYMRATQVSNDDFSTGPLINFNGVSHSQFLNQQAYSNGVLSSGLLIGPTYPNRVSNGLSNRPTDGAANACLLNGQIDSKGVSNGDFSTLPTNFNGVSNGQFLNQQAYSNGVLSSSLLIGPTDPDRVSNGLSNRPTDGATNACLLNGQIDSNGVSNALSNEPTDFYGASNGHMLNGPTCSDTTLNDGMSNGPTYSNGVSNGCLSNEQTDFYGASSSHVLNGPTNSNGVSYCHLLNGSTYSNRVSNGYFSNWPTDPYGVWLPPTRTPESKEDDPEPQV